MRLRTELTRTTGQMRTSGPTRTTAPNEPTGQTQTVLLQFGSDMNIVLVDSTDSAESAESTDSDTNN